MAFPPRIVEKSPDGYPDLVLPIRINITQREHDALYQGSTENEETTAQLGHGLSTVYNQACVSAYGYTFDFSTPEKAVETLLSDDLPLELRLWLRNAPVELIGAEADFLLKTFRASLTPGS
jgi:hypothetical protein